MCPALISKRISEHGVAFDLHNLYKHIPGKEKTKANLHNLNNKDSNNLSRYYSNKI